MPNFPPAARLRPPRASRRGTQRGVVMAITLIVLLIMLLGATTLARSARTSLLMAGDLGFKRDLLNQGERGMAKAVSLLASGALSSEAARQSNLPASNYSASTLACDAHGVPRVLLDAGVHASAGMGAADLADGSSGVTIRYVIDRLCAAAGPFDPATCSAAPALQDKGGTNWVQRAGGEPRPVYRISVKVTGPRRTEAYLQSTFAL